MVGVSITPQVGPSAEEMPPDVAFSISEVAWVLTEHMKPFFASAGQPNGWADPAVAVALVMAESGGRSGARRDEKDNPLGGVDRGWWQLNSKALPNVTDAKAYRPTEASEIVWDLSQGGTDFSCWGYRFNPPRTTFEACPNFRKGTQRTDLNLAAARAAIANPTPCADKLIAASTTSDDTVTPNPGLPDAPGWLTSLGRLLANLIDPSWWRRLGTGALGLLLVVLAVVVLFATAR